VVKISLKKNLLVGGIAAIVSGTGCSKYSDSRKESYENKKAIANAQNASDSWKFLADESLLHYAEKAAVICAKQSPKIQSDPEIDSDMKEIFARNKDAAYFFVSPNSQAALRLELQEGHFGLYAKGQKLESGSAEGMLRMSLEIDHHFSGARYVIKECRDFLHPGKRAPDFTATTLDGRQISLKDYLGKPVILEFWTTDCRPCIAKIPRNKELFNKYNPHIIFIGISLDSDPSKPKKLAFEQGVPYQQVCDGTGWEGPLAQKYQVNVVPMRYLIDKSGHVAARSAGYSTELKGTAEEESEIERLINQK